MRTGKMESRGEARRKSVSGERTNDTKKVLPVSHQGEDPKEKKPSPGNVCDDKTPRGEHAK